MGHLSHWVIFNLIVTGLSSTYNDIGQITLRWLIKRWFQRNVRIQNLKWTTVVWVRASVLSNKSSMRWFIVIFAIKCPNSKCFVERGLNMGHLSHWVIFNLIVTGLSSTYNDIGQITLRWLIKRWFQRNVRIQNLKWNSGLS